MSLRTYIAALLTFALLGSLAIGVTNSLVNRRRCRAADTLYRLSSAHERLAACATLAKRSSHVVGTSRESDHLAAPAARSLVQKCSEAVQALSNEGHQFDPRHTSTLASYALRSKNWKSNTKESSGVPGAVAEAIVALRDTLFAAIQEAEVAVSDIQSTSAWLLRGMSAVYLVALLLAWRAVASRVVRPITDLAGAGQAAMACRAPFSSPSGGPREVQNLASTVVSFVRSLEENVHEQTQQLSIANNNLRIMNATLRKETTQRKSMEDQLRHSAYHDALTRLPNRQLLMDRIRSLVERSKRNAGFRFAVLFLDIDNFKHVNDSLGHGAGDTLLTDVALRLSACVRSLDTVNHLDSSTTARIGGDEFVVLLDDIRGPHDAVVVAERIQEQLSRPVRVGDHSIVLSASIGIAINDGATLDAGSILRDADTAMYRAKQAGKMQHAVFDSTMHAAANLRLRLESELRMALEKRQFTLAFQPIVNLETGRMNGLEALLRWSHPERGIIMPDEFITLAEETGLIIPLGEWVLTRACSQLREWHKYIAESRDVSMSVNISRRQLITPGFGDSLERIIAASGIAPDGLNLEVTESVVLEVSDQLPRILDQIKALGVRVHMDDFGTGHSSLSSLKDLPVDVLKIDRSFVQTHSDGRAGLGIMAGIMTMARSMGIEVVAEGVEDEEALAALLALDCDFGQGYFFSKPADARTAADIIVSGGDWTKSRAERQCAREQNAANV